MTFSLESDTRSGFSVRLLAQSSLTGLAAIVLLLWVVFTSLAPGFVSSFNLFAISRSLAIDIVIGFSTMVVLATGGMNLAIGSIGVCSVMLSGYLMQRLGMPVPAALAAGLLMGALLGWTNGVSHCPLGRKLLHHHAGERQPLCGRHADPDQGGHLQ